MRRTFTSTFSSTPASIGLVKFPPWYLMALLLTSLVLFLVALLIDRQNESRFHQQQTQDVLLEMSLVRAQLEGSISANLQTVRGLAAAISVEPNMDQQRFAQFARPLISGKNTLRNIGAAPDMVIRLMYPLKGNENAVGLDLASNPAQREAAQRARLTGKLVVAGPVNLVQGGKGFIGRIPVFTTDANREASFWGVISAVIDVEQLFADSGIYRDDLAIDLALRGKDGKGAEGEVFYGPEHLFRQQPLLVDVTLPTGSWQMAAVPKGGWSVRADNAFILRVGLGIVCAVIIALLSLFFSNIQKRRDDTTRLQALFELSPIGIALNDLNTGQFLMFNNALIKPLGYSEEEFLQLSYWDVTPGDYAEQEAEQTRLLKATGRYGPYEKEYIRKSGRRYPVLLNGLRIEDSSGRQLIWSMVEDISERKKASELLAHQQEMLEQMSKVARVGAWEYDVASEQMRWSETTGSIFGVHDGHPTDLQAGINLCEDTESRDALAKAFQSSITEGGSWNLELKLKIPDGRSLWVLVSGQAEWVDGSCKRVFGSIQDIHARKQHQMAAEQSSRHNEVLAELTVHHAVLAGDLPGCQQMLVERMAYALDVARVSLWMASADQQHIECVSQYEAANRGTIVGEQLPRKDYPNYFNALQSHACIAVSDAEADARTREFSDHYLKHLGITSLLDSVISVGGGLVGVLCAEHIGPRREWTQAEQAFVTSLATLTGNVYASEQRRLAAAELVIAKDEAEAAARAKSEFLAAMSHEIRTPMNGVLGMLNLLQRSNLEQDQERKVFVAKNSAESLLGLINDILDFSKVDAGKLELERLEFNLRDMIGDFAESMAIRAQEKNLELILDLKGIDITMVKGDPGRLRQIFTNLVSNAIKFTEQGEVLIRCSLRKTSDGLLLEGLVGDTGIGIPADKQQALFEPFTQLDASTTRHYGGTGLGLAISKNICELMRGEIRVSSELGKGSRFEFNVLLEPASKTQFVRPSLNISQFHLLIVDDNATSREVLRDQLEHWGASVTVAKNGEEALRLCAESVEPFSLALLDKNMSTMDGLELGRRIKASLPSQSIPLVLMTGMESLGDFRSFAEQGFSAYFPKPVTTADLFLALSVLDNEGGSAGVSSHYGKTLHSENNGQPPKPSANWSGQRLLIVDDNAINQEVAQLILLEMGLTADVAGNGIEAIKALAEAPEEDPYTLVLMDCQMPDMDGYEATRQIRAGQADTHNSDIVIIAMTANAMKGDKEKCLEAGMNDYLSKPIDAEKLAVKLEQWTNTGIGQI